MAKCKPSNRTRSFVLPKAYFVGEVARVLSVAPVTVQRMCDRGELKCYRIGRDRKISHKELMRFLTANNMLDHASSLESLGEFEQAVASISNPIIVFTKHPEVKAACRDVEFVMSVDGWVDLGMVVRDTDPRAVVLDLFCGKEECVQTAMRLHNERPRPTIVTIVYGEDRQVDESGLWDWKVRFPDELHALGAILRKTKKR